MVKSKTLLFVKVLIGVYIVQILLPVFLIISIMIVKHNQHSLIEKYAVNHNLYIKLELNKNKFSKLVITNDEFLYQNDLYDIKSINEGGGKIVLTVIKDNAEKKLKQANEQFVKRTTKNTFKLLKACQLVFTYFENKDNLNLNIESFVSRVDWYKIDMPDKPFTGVKTPPPDILLFS